MANHPLQSSGQISLRDIELEFNVASGTRITLKDAKNGVYGAISSVTPNPTTGNNSITGKPKDGLHITDWYGYNQNASVPINFLGGFDSPNVDEITLQSDGKMLCGGCYSNYQSVQASSIIRLNANGTRDTAFNSGGYGFDGCVKRVIFQSDNSILIGGAYDKYNTITRIALVKLNSDGSFNSTFASNMGTGFNGNTSNEVDDIAIQSDGKIVLVGGIVTFNGGNLIGNIVRLNSDGTPDTAFATAMGSGVNPAGVNQSAFAVCVQSDDKILIGGAFSAFKGTTRNRLLRLNTNGSEDTAFYTNLGTGFDTTAGNYIREIALQADGKILVGGGFTSLNGTSRNRLVRLNTNGTVDTAFQTNFGTGFNAEVQAITVQPDGKILVGGYFTQFKGVTRNYLVRLNSDGTEDTAFYAKLGTAFNNYVQAMTVMPDLKILVGGGFTTLNGVTKGRICQLAADGTIMA